MDGKIKNYAQGMRERTEARKAAKEPVFPNLTKAAANYDPKRDEPKTYAQLADEQRAAESAGQTQQPRGLSQETIEGMMQLKATQEAKIAELPPPKEPEPGDDKAIQDLELAAVLRALREDPINNERERLAVAARVKPIDLSEGLLTGEFTQVVPVIPDRLTVTFRTLSGVEHQELRLKLHRAIDANPELERVNGELLGIYQTVASLKKFGDTTYASHLQREVNGTVKFLESEFDKKVGLFMAMPLQLIGLLGTHGSWFDGRVRELFTSTEALKNG